MALALVASILLATLSDNVFGKHAHQVADPLGLGSSWCASRDGRMIPGTWTMGGTPAVDCGKVNEAVPYPVKADPMFWDLTPCQLLQEIMRLIALLSPSTPIPQCDSQGSFSFRLCDKDGEVCWCVDKTGKEVNGTRTPAGTPPVNCSNPFQNGTASINIDLPVEADSASRRAMGHAAIIPHVEHNDIRVAGSKEQHPELEGLTECQRQRAIAEAMVVVPPGFFVPECAADGSFLPVQCSGSSGFCWCVDVDGQKIPGTMQRPGSKPLECNPTSTVSSDSPSNSPAPSDSA